MLNVKNNYLSDISSFSTSSEQKGRMYSGPEDVHNEWLMVKTLNCKISKYSLPLPLFPTVYCTYHQNA